MSIVKEPIKEAVKPIKKDYKYLRDRDREMVRGIFRFFEVPGGTLSFPFKKWKEDKVEVHTFVDGNIYTVPRGVASHLCNNGWYPENSYRMDERGVNIAVVAKKKHRFSFDPLDFMDMEDLRELTSSTVETVTMLK